MYLNLKTSLFTQGAPITPCSSLPKNIKNKSSFFTKYRCAVNVKCKNSSFEPLTNDDLIKKSIYSNQSSP